MADRLAELLDGVHQALAARRPVYIRAGDSKRNCVGRLCEAPALDVGEHAGITAYEPGELVLSARAATPLTELEAALAEQDQVLPFEPPRCGGRATLGGTLACHLSGPARPWRGSVRDAVLGVQMINGRGKLLNFGGRVMKNVAGYDVSRLQAGALGTLGLLTEIHLKVLPRPESTRTLSWSMAAGAAVDTMTARARESAPLTGACWTDGVLYLRLAGAAQAVAATARRWGGDPCDDRIWEQLRELSHPVLTGEAPLWRLSTTPTLAPCEHTVCIDWGGAQRWLRGEPASRPLPAGTRLTLFAGGDRKREVCTPPHPVERQLQLRLKLAFDPQGLFNPGRLYGWM